VQSLQPLLSEDRVAALARGESVQVRVQGVSMLPWLRPGESVCIQPVNRELYPGDIALFWREKNQPVLHRVVRTHLGGDSDTVDCLGDSEYGSPEVVPTSSIIGLAEMTLFRRWIFRVVHPPRRFLNRLCCRLGVRLRHG